MDYDWRDFGSTRNLVISKNKLIDDWLDSLPLDRQSPASELRDVIVNNLPEGFEEVMAGSPAYVVPLTLFPAGYHVSPDTPLPFMSFANQKNFIALHHFGMYVDQELLKWFEAEYPKHSSTKLDMGKSCVRFKKVDKIPFTLLAELAKKRSVEDWVSLYQKQLSL